MAMQRNLDERYERGWAALMRAILFAASVTLASACSHQHGDPPPRPPTAPLPMTSTPETHATFGDDAGLQSTDPMNGAGLATDGGVGAGGAGRDAGAATASDAGTMSADAGTRRGK